MTAIGINGFGRMGRLVVRALQQHPDLHLVHINELKGSADTAAHLLEFDTVHGRYPGTVAVTPTGDQPGLQIDDHMVTFSQQAAPDEIDWARYGVDIVVEATGAFRTVDAIAPHLRNGAKRVVVAAPVKDDRVLNVVMGCNDHLYQPETHTIVTAASCTTNAIAPVVKVIHETWGIERGAITTIHDVTNTQVVVDAPHHDLRRSRSALNSLIPTSTGSATAITMIYPDLVGRLNGLAVRVPLLNASLVDCVFTLGTAVTADEVNTGLATAAQGPLRGILGYEDRPLVSADFTNDTRSGVVDGPSTMVIDEQMIKVLVWYDNEMGYVFRMAELCSLVASSLNA